jgi:sodium/proline symporter
VTLAWSLLASSLGPLLVARVLNQPVSAFWGTAMMFGGAASALVWRYELEFGEAIFDVLPGMLGGFLIFGASVLWRQLRIPTPARQESADPIGD